MADQLPQLPGRDECSLVCSAICSLLKVLLEPPSSFLKISCFVFLDNKRAARLSTSNESLQTAVSVLARHSSRPAQYSRK